MSALLGSASPDGWLCANITNAALCVSAAFTTSRGYTLAWEGVHLHEFQFRDEAYGISDLDWGQGVRSQNRVKLRNVLAGSKRMTLTLLGMVQRVY